jgi:hypothetical protein
MTVISPPGHIIWSTDRLDLADPFQRKWCIRQVIAHGRADDIASLDLDGVARRLDELSLPPHLHGLWARFLEARPERDGLTTWAEHEFPFRTQRSPTSAATR